MSILLSPVELKSESSLKRGDPRVKHIHHRHQENPWLRTLIENCLFEQIGCHSRLFPSKHTHTYTQKGTRNVNHGSICVGKWFDESKREIADWKKSYVHICRIAGKEELYWQRRDKREKKLLTVMKSGQLMKMGRNLGQLGLQRIET